MTSKFALALLLGVAAAPVCYAPSALAQTETVVGLPEIVVTAQRREESLQRAAVAVTAVTGDALSQAGVTDVQSISRVVPSLVVQTQGGGASVYLRGVGNQQTNAFGENAIAFSFDGVYLARPTAPFGLMYDLERIEVLKGPQGTLYGRNATGGAVNILPKRATLGNFSGDLTAEYGNYNAGRLTGGVNIPIGDKVAVRVAGQVVKRDGYLSDGYSDEEGQAGRISLLAELSPAWTLRLTGDYFHQGGKGQGGVLVPSAYVPQAPAISDKIANSDPRSVAAFLAFGDSRPPFGALIRNGSVLTPRNDGFVDSDFYGFSGVLEGDLGFATLTVQPAYRHSAPDYLFYFTGFRGEMHEADEQKSLEARLASKGDGPFQYVVGAFYFKEEQEALNFFNQGLLSTARFNPNLTTESQAVFGQATYAVVDGLRLVGGLRYTQEDRGLTTQLAAGTPTNVNPPFGRVFTGSQSASKVTWKGGVEYDVNDTSLLYANVATGFKSGGFFVGASPNNSFGPETLTAYTAGSKNTFFDNRVRLNLEAFYWKYKDQQISFVGGIDAGASAIAVGGKTVNAGQSRLYGLEMEAEWQATERDVLRADVQYLDAEYESFRYTALSASGAPIRSGCLTTGNRLANPGTPDPARLFDIDCSGKPLLSAPRWSTQFSYEHRFDLREFQLRAGARTRIDGARDLTIDFLPESRQKSYTMSDAYLTLGHRDQGWELTGFVNNIEDNTVMSSGFIKAVVQTYYATLRPPRTYGARINYKF